MFIRILVSLLLLITLVNSSKVHILTDANFADFISTNPYVFVKFYAEWCGHCKSMIPEYEKLATLSEGRPFAIAKIDAPENTKTGENYKVDGYPTLKFFANGIALNYDGERTAEAIFDWISNFQTSEVKTLSTNQITEKIGKETFLVFQGAGEEDKKIIHVASALEKNIELYYQEGTDKKITLYLQNGNSIEYTGELEIKALISFILSKTLPIVVPLDSPDSIKAVFENSNKKPAMLLVKGKDDITSAQAAFQSYCKNSDTFLCCYVTDEHKVYEGVVNYLKISIDAPSTLSYMQFGLTSIYIYPSTFADATSESLVQFLEDVKAGNIAKTVDAASEQPKSSEIKYENVVKLTDETFNETIKSNKYVLVEFYSGTCGHCVKFAPEYDLLAKNIQDAGLDIVIGGVNVPQNKGIQQQVSIAGLPTFKFYLNGEQIDYNTDRNISKIQEFLKDILTTKLNEVDSINKLQKPFIAIYGLKDDSALEKLSAFYTAYPIYQVTGQKDAKFKIQIHNDFLHEYKDKENINRVISWIEETTQPHLFNVLLDPPSKKMEQAFSTQTPALLLINRFDGTEKHVLEFMNHYCLSTGGIACGYANKGDKNYDSFQNWLNDTNVQKNKIILLDTMEFKHSFYTGDLAEIDSNKADAFIKQTKAKSEQEREQAKKSGKQTQASNTKETETESGEVAAAEEKGEEL